MNALAKLDHRYLWHPFTQMRDWLKREPIVIVEGRGTVLQDAKGREYLDANSSIWTNLHGHNHPRLNAAIRGQLRRVAHTSALGLANEPASLLAAQLVAVANRRTPALPPRAAGREGASLAKRDAGLQNAANRSTQPFLGKVFFSDDGSTAMEVALKLAYEYSRRVSRTVSPRFLSLAGAYHGDTVGAVSLGHIDLFHRAYRGLLFKTDKVMSPYCYRCRFNRAKPERADARVYRKCQWECLEKVEQKFQMQKKKGTPYSGFIFEPLMQGAAGMIPQPAGWLGRAAQIARGHGALLIADEVMTAFGRTGIQFGTAVATANPLGVSPRGRIPGGTSAKRTREDSGATRTDAPLFACQHEGVQPDFIALAKGLTGGYLPMAATLTTQAVFDAFLGEYDEFKTFFHGHSFTGNQLGASAALASLQLLQSSNSIRARQRLERWFAAELEILWSLPNVGDIRRIGVVAGVELVKDWRTREPYELRARAGIRVCEAMALRRVLTRSVGNVIVLMPPYCTTAPQVRKMVAALAGAIREVCAE